MRAVLVLFAWMGCADPADKPDSHATQAPATLEGPRTLAADGDETTLTLCTDGADNGTDGLVDCLDDDCAAFCTDADNDGYCPVGQDDNNDDSCSNTEIDTATRDCDDTRPTMFPGNTENTYALCTDTLDNDCDAAFDGAESTCDPFDGTEDDVADCDDGEDNDGDGDVDCADADCETFCDGDGDTYCENGKRDNNNDGFCNEGTLGTADCDDTLASINPGATDVVADGIDQNCDGVDHCYPDTDRDGFGDSGSSGAAGAVSCATAGDTWAANNTDCNNSQATAYPGAPENTFALCSDTLNNNCNVSDGTDAADSDCAQWADNDGDGYCEDSTNCIAPALTNDCDDNASTGANSAPNLASEGTYARCHDGYDNDCSNGADYPTDPNCSAFDGTESGLADCGDGYDNDGDNTTDAGDTDCAAFVDNDGDGYCESSSCVDGSTPNDCNDDASTGGNAVPGGTSETTYALCHDGYDNDCTNGGDYPADPNCADFDGDENDLADCNDGVDNDGDGQIDCNDSSCTAYCDADGDSYCESGNRDVSPVDGFCETNGTLIDCDDDPTVGANSRPNGTAETTFPLCTDGYDNDCSGSGDNPDDPNCAAFDGAESNGTACNDNQDNDGDGFIDENDTGCANFVDNDGDGYCENAPCADGSTSGDCDDTVGTGTNSVPGGLSETTYARCHDSYDNDCSNGGDYPNDPSCDPFDGSENTAAKCGDGKDNDGDGTIDDADSDCPTFYDDDGDGYCEANNCSDGSTGGDCDDTLVTGLSSRPGGTAETTFALCSDGYDNDCSNGADNGVDPNCAAFDGNENNATACGDGVDNDGDGAVDASDSQCPTFYDDDGDGYCEAASCADGSTGGDCDDNTIDGNLSRPNGTAETTFALCYDGYDNDCSGQADYPDDASCGSFTGGEVDKNACDDNQDNDGDGLTDCADNDCAQHCDSDGDRYCTSGNRDVNGDGHCEHNDSQADCNEGVASINPGASEVVADGIDQDCDGVDSCYLDSDNDRYGVQTIIDGPSLDCSPQGTGYSNVNTDCNDADPNNFPNNVEACDGVDNDCDGLAEDGLVFVDYYPDDDSDSYGDASAAAVRTCSGAPAGHVTDNTDCNDNGPTEYPGATEVPANAIDENCDGADDCYEDGDDDGFGRNQQRVGDDMTCDGPNESSRNDDCDDSDPTEFPSQSWYADCDGDGFYRSLAISACDRGEASGLTSCGSPLGGYVNTAPVEADCDDLDGVEFPGQTWYADCDGDGSFQIPSIDGCSVADAATRTPCADGLAPDGGWVNDEPATRNEDCDDENTNRSPLLVEECEINQTQVDNDCDGDVNGVGPNGGEPINSSDFWTDFDLDGFGEPGTPVRACESAPGLVTNDLDCDDGDPGVYIGAAEICDGRDQNCNSLIDEPDQLDVQDASFCIELYRDQDGDGYGDQGTTQCLCADPSDLTYEYDNETYVATFSDCDDLHADIRPHECNDGADNDRDGDGVDSGDPDCAPRIDPTDGILKQPAFEDGTDIFVEELIDGHDNDCDGFIPIIELDCDDDGSFPRLPLQPTDGVRNADDVGLAWCTDGPIQMGCWEDNLTLECDEVTGLWQTRWGVSDDGFGGRFSQAYRNLSDVGCDSSGDCDDRCAARCPGVSESCDGLDNDCSGVAAEVDTDGIPQALEDAVIPGTLSPTELDGDGDGFAACVDDFRAEASQFETTYAGCDVLVDPERDSDCDDLCYLANDQAVEACNGFVDLCGTTLAVAEGSDADRDDHFTCGAYGSGENELDEQLFLAVWVACDGRSGCESVTASAPAGVEPWVPLLLPRRIDGVGTAECDVRLEEQLDLLLGAVGAGVSADLTESSDLTAVCAPETGGVCTTVVMTLGTSVDTLTASGGIVEDALAAGRTSQECMDRPEQYLSRAVWNADRIGSARRAVVELECLRLYGVSCDDISTESTYVGSPFPPDIDDLLEDADLWWQEAGRYAPSSATGALMTCWGDPTAGGLQSIESRVGGDCSDDRTSAHRDQPEGPGDLLGVYLGEEGDCGLCTDGIDNNCDGRIDCEDPSCDLCFVGQGRGCDGARDPCNPKEEGSGCQSSPSAGWPWLLPLLVFIPLGRRRRAA